MRRLLPVSFVVLAACAGGRAPEAAAPRVGAARAAVLAGRARIPTTWGMAGRARTVAAARAMVVSGHPLASEVGAEVLKRGGNAIDATVAVSFALAAVLPDAGNIGGGGFIVYRETAGRVRTLDYREKAPAAASRDMYLDAQGNPTDHSVTGHRAAGVPGSVAGLYEAWKQHGTRPWAELIEPAIRLAEGHVIDAARHRDLADDAERLARFPASRRQFLVNGRAPARGTTWRQPDLARTLRLIADSGPAVFYRGQIADLIVAEMERGGGLITKEDLRRYRAAWRSPIQLRYRGHLIYSMPPPSSGGVTMGEILNIMEGYDTLPPFGSAAYVHREAEAMRRAFIDRNRWLGDPDFVRMPLERLLSKSYAAQLRAQIDLRRATPTPPFATDETDGAHTTHFSVVDADGNAASVTTTLNNSFGSAVTVTGAGFLLNDEMDDFATAPGKPNLYGLVQGEANAIASGKRMLSAMTPSIVLDTTGRLLMVVGSPGGPRIITAVYHVIANVLDHRMSLADAVAAPRLHHQALPDSISLEPGGFSPAVMDSLRAMGHGVREWGYRGLVMAIQRSPAGWVGVADPRSGGGAVGY
ncbi:MAG: gamma-glutamyltransferase [Gemmatimonadetes bacterium]|nr:gamma-glutamyltransferase [Gemmatimonadota bacterium]